MEAAERKRMKNKTYYIEAPTNIALLKYWGKQCEAKQWPANNSLSMTLSEWKTKCRISVLKGEGGHEFYFNDRLLQASDGFAKKAYSHIDLLTKKLSLTKRFKVCSENTFPTGCGVASSASSMAALTLGILLAGLDLDHLDDLVDAGWDLNKIADLARLGSGSACRSLLGGFVLWEAGNKAENQCVSQLYDETWWPLEDTLIVFSDKPKSVSSSQAHKNAWSSPFFAPRVAGCPERQLLMSEGIRKKDFSLLGPALESEALEMHAVMMTANPATNYLSKDSMEFLASFRRFRQEKDAQLWFTIDAGPNIHILGEPKEQEKLASYLKTIDSDIKWLKDSVGAGPKVRVNYE